MTDRSYRSLSGAVHTDMQDAPLRLAKHNPTADPLGEGAAGRARELLGALLSAGQLDARSSTMLWHRTMDRQYELAHSGLPTRTPASIAARGAGQSTAGWPFQPGSCSSSLQLLLHWWGSYQKAVREAGRSHRGRHHPPGCAASPRAQRVGAGAVAAAARACWPAPRSAARPCWSTCARRPSDEYNDLDTSKATNTLKLPASDVGLKPVARFDCGEPQWTGPGHQGLAEGSGAGRSRPDRRERGYAIAAALHW